MSEIQRKILKNVKSDVFINMKKISCKYLHILLLNTSLNDSNLFIIKNSHFNSKI